MKRLRTPEKKNFPKRAIIEGVSPEIDGGRFPIKRVVGERVVVEADIFLDGHDLLDAVLKFRKRNEKKWREVAMKPLGNDRFRGVFSVEALGFYEYTLETWVDPFSTWLQDLQKRLKADQDVAVELRIGATWVDEASRRASGPMRQELLGFAKALRSRKPQGERVAAAMDPELGELMKKHPDRGGSTLYAKTLEVEVDREKARFSTWYELFPRSTAEDSKQHGTFKDCESRLAYIAEMGFDVLYLPPIHPIGRSFRKGKNNSLHCEAGDPGSPWAIGSQEGGHKSIHRELGTFKDFERFLKKAGDYGLEIALDIAFQCSPDHPYVQEHPRWFRWRPDRSIQYAENPPKKYQDIYPIHFETEDWQALWEELKAVVQFWIQKGIKIFRVDNPHTKPFEFWEFLIREIKSEHPEVIFLSEAFTRPKVMYHLAKLGFNQSYTYFAWRNAKWELREYFEELTQTEIREFFRPNLWPNTPDILTEFLQNGGRAAFMIRAVLAGTLGASYGIYGPAFELCESKAREPGSEEYLNSEKYEIKHWDLHRTGSLKDFVGRINRIRRENSAIRYNETLKFHPVDNDQVLCFSKHAPGDENMILVVVNLDPFNTHRGWVDLPLEELGIDPHQPFQVHDLLGDARYQWRGSHNYVELDPHVVPAHIFIIRRKLRSERDFDYYG